MSAGMKTTANNTGNPYNPPDQNRRFSIFFSFLFEAIFFVTAELVLNNRLNFSLKGFPLY